MQLELFYLHRYSYDPHPPSNNREPCAIHRSVRCPARTKFNRSFYDFLRFNEIPYLVPTVALAAIMLLLLSMLRCSRDPHGRMTVLSAMNETTLASSKGGKRPELFQCLEGSCAEAKRAHAEVLLYAARKTRPLLPPLPPI